MYWRTKEVLRIITLKFVRIREQDKNHGGVKRVVRRENDPPPPPSDAPASYRLCRIITAPPSHMTIQDVQAVIDVVALAVSAAGLQQ